ncbi:glycosyl hydrolase 2 galactose-binding domain-containing protein [Paenibacillus qinlingensis]|uniref:beta-mannosidase n=1 Tax=Paenibacillus qinlingensis TaxID=1837343 RepID=A0ABU1P065_9BACL|nr:glycoside hydrolase family 2 TIM barrel-domain containing protein [Paenibacillus qinlingensis]MDR6553143.1 beta-mannosidase [Paenibacillus qinlingensis]
MNSKLILKGNDWKILDFIDEAWRTKQVESDEPTDPRPWVKATVPGSIHQDLWDNGIVPDPYFEQNSLMLEWIPQRSWVYRKTFFVEGGKEGSEARLHLHGIDYRAHIYLNGTLLGSHESMFVPAEYEVASHLRYGADNLLTVVLDPAPPSESQMGRTSKVGHTKTRMNYWWDFTPRMIHLGIWQEVYIAFSGPVTVEDIYIRPQLNMDYTRAEVSVDIELISRKAISAEIDLTIAHNGSQVAILTCSAQKLTEGVTKLEVMMPIDDPELWWPNGEGAQPLYQLTVSVRESGAEEVMYQRETEFGIRQVEFSPNETSHPTALPYTFTLNGRKVYVKGYNWVPIDVLYGVERLEKLEHLLTLAKEANVNLIRVNGVGLIETDAFYNLCNRLGLMVWQEFNLTSSAFNSKPKEDESFINQVIQEAESIIPLKRNHPSLVLWCGGNELESLDKLPLNEEEPVLAALKAIVKRLDPDRLWLPCSPSGPLPFNGINMSRNRPDDLHDVHGPWHHEGLTAQYTLFNAGANLLHSEFGADGLTNLKALEATLKPENRWPVTLHNPVWYHLGSWWVQEKQWRDIFGELSDLETAIEATQYLQAEGVRYAIERNRARKFRNSGVLPWMFNEPYPMAACTSAIDYFGRPKHLYYASAQAYNTVSVTAKFAKQAWANDLDFKAELWVTNGGTQDYTEAELHWSMEGDNGNGFASGMRRINVGANVADSFGDISCQLPKIHGNLFFLTLQLKMPSGIVIASNRYLFTTTENLQPMLDLPRTVLDIQSDCKGPNWSITVTNRGECAALLVRIDDERSLDAEGWGYISHSGFHLLPGESRTVTVVWKGTGTHSVLSVQALNADKRIVE